VSFGLVVGERHGWVVQEAQRVLSARDEPEQQIMSGAARRAPAAFAVSFLRQRRLRLVEGQPFGDDSVVTALETRDQARLQRKLPFSGESGRMTGAAQQALHFARPILLLDFDERFEFAKMVRVAQRM